MNHAVVAVGYGSQYDPKLHRDVTYFIIRNSWGPHWGDKGYAKVESGACDMFNYMHIAFTKQETPK